MATLVKCAICDKKEHPADKIFTCTECGDEFGPCCASSEPLVCCECIKDLADIDEEDEDDIDDEDEDDFDEDDDDDDEDDDDDDEELSNDEDEDE